MKAKLTKYLCEKWQSYCSFILMILIIFGMMFYLMELNNCHLDIPLFYLGGDDMGVIVNAKQFTEQAWNMTCDRLGAPFSVQYYDFTASMMHNIGLFIMKIFAVISGDAAIAMNLTYLSIFFITGIISYFVMRNLKINYWVSALSSSVFALSPYMLYRNISHIVLTECYFVPLSILICIWIYEREDALTPDKNFFKRKINYVVLFFAFLIANNGIAYYPFFTCFILMVTAVSKLAKTGKIKQGLRSVIAVVMICIFVVLSILPGKIYTLMNGTNAAAIDRAGFEQTELYGLKIAQLFMPLNGHGWYDKYIDIYNDNAFLVTENSSAYLGILGMIGFVVLMVCLFTKKDSLLKKRLGCLSELNIAMVLLGTIGGLGSMFAFFVSPMLRAYNRISIFIEYVSILAVALLVDRFIQCVNENKKEFSLMFKKNIISAVIVIFGLASLFSIWEGYPQLATPTYEVNEMNYTSDKDFVADIENCVESGSMIYQLPYHQYPEYGPVNNMWDYHLYIGYLHSKTLKWSYGSIKGRAEDEWNEKVSLMPVDEMVSYLKNENFAGIYIDRRAYEQEELDELEGSLEQILGEKPMVSENSNLSFFKF